MNLTPEASAYGHVNNIMRLSKSGAPLAKQLLGFTRQMKLDRGPIEQVLLNIFVNSQQAMPDGGAIYIKTENVVLDDDGALPFSF